jgi:hypothetical protein
MSSKALEIALALSQQHKGMIGTSNENDARYHTARMRSFDKAASAFAEGNYPQSANGNYFVKSMTKNAVYRVSAGICNCAAGLRGRDCWHVAAIECVELADSHETAQNLQQDCDLNVYKDRDDF